MKRKEVLPRSSAAGSSAIARDFGQVGAAITAGIFLGIIWSFYSPHGLFNDSNSTEVGCALTDEHLSLKEDVKVAQRENTVLKASLKHLQQETEAAQKQLLALRPPTKVGPLGTVRSLRTFLTVRPDEAVNSELANLLAEVAIDREVIVGIANSNVREMVRVWFASLKSAGVTNFMLVALDDRMAEFCRLNRVPFYRRDATISRAQEGTGDNHAISGLKFHLLREFMVLGYSVLLSDVDIVYLQNPFLYLHRDCDVEAMTDGADNQTAYGFDDVSDDPKMGWSRYAHTMRIWVFNSGFFYIRPTIASIDLLDRVTSRLRKQKAWDQAVFNEELFFPSHPGYEGLHASKRAMDFYLFMNSKVMFTRVRTDPNFDKFLPVVVHVNYHPDKFERMLALLEYYVNGRKDALKRFPDGSE